MSLFLVSFSFCIICIYCLMLFSKIEHFMTLNKVQYFIMNAVHESVPRHAVVQWVGVASQGVCYETGAL